MTSDERIITMLRGGLSAPVIAAILDIEPDDIRDVLTTTDELPATGGGGGSSAPTEAGATRPLDQVFALPDPTKAYWVRYTWDTVTAGHAEAIAWHGIPDGAGWLQDAGRGAVAVFDEDGATIHRVVLEGKVPAGHSIYLQITTGVSEGVVVAALETPLA